VWELTPGQCALINQSAGIDGDDVRAVTRQVFQEARCLGLVADMAAPDLDAEWRKVDKPRNEGTSE
jgi:predicted component of type VI protein secretion system